MIFGLLYFCVVVLCVNRSRSSFILYRIVKRHSRQSNVRRIWTCADNVYKVTSLAKVAHSTKYFIYYIWEANFKSLSLCIILKKVTLYSFVPDNRSF